METDPKSRVMALVEKRCRPLHSIAFATKKNGKPMFPSWPKLRNALVLLQAEGKIELGLVHQRRKGEYLYIYKAGRMPEDVRAI